MRLAYAKTRSDASVKREGGEEELEIHKRRRLAEKGESDHVCDVWMWTRLSLSLSFSGEGHAHS